MASLDRIRDGMKASRFNGAGAGNNRFGATAPGVSVAQFPLPSPQNLSTRIRGALDAGGIVAVSVARRLGPGRGWELIKNAQEAVVSRQR